MQKFLFILFTLFMFSNIYANEAVKVVYESKNKPYSYIGSGGKAEGILVDIVDKILREKLNLNVEHIAQPYKKAQKSIRGGYIDAIMTTPVSEKFAYSKSISNYLYSIEWKAFISKKSRYYYKLIGDNNPLENTGLNYACLYGDSKTQIIYKKHGINCQSVKNISTVIQMLSSGEVDVFLHSKSVALSHLSKLGMKNSVTIHKKSYVNIPITLMFSKKSKLDLISDIDKALNEMILSGEYQEFIEEVEDRY